MKIIHCNKIAIIILLVSCFFETTAQVEDSIIVTKLANNFIEIKSTRFILKEGYGVGHGSVVVMHYRPNVPIIENGIVVIKDRNNNILEVAYYNDSIRVLREYYHKNILESQDIYIPGDTSLLQQTYYKNGQIQSFFIREKTGPTIVIDYSESGEITEKRIEDWSDRPIDSLNNEYQFTSSSTHEQPDSMKFSATINNMKDNFQSNIYGRFLLKDAIEVKDENCAGFNFINSTTVLWTNEIYCNDPDTLKIRWLDNDTFMTRSTERINEKCPPGVGVYQVISFDGKTLVLMSVWTGWDDYNDERLTFIKQEN